MTKPATTPERIIREQEIRELAALASHLEQDPVLRELWNNEKDAAYDELCAAWAVVLFTSIVDKKVMLSYT